MVNYQRLTIKGQLSKVKYQRSNIQGNMFVTNKVNVRISAQSPISTLVFAKRNFSLNFIKLDEQIWNSYKKFWWWSLRASSSGSTIFSSDEKLGGDQLLSFPTDDFVLYTSYGEYSGDNWRVSGFENLVLGLDSC